MPDETSKGAILLVEDHVDTANLFAKLLRRDDHHVAIASDYASALALARSRRFDVLVCDIGLPDGDGCDLLREVRSLYPIRGLAVTGYGTDRDLRRCTEAKFDAHLVKPVGLENVRDALAAFNAPGTRAAAREDRRLTSQLSP